jgi:hypothetical protein
MIIFWMATVPLCPIHVHSDIRLVLGAMITHGILVSIWVVVPAQLPPIFFLPFVILLVIVMHPRFLIIACLILVICCLQLNAFCRTVRLSLQLCKPALSQLLTQLRST